MTFEQIKFTIEQIRKFDNQKKETNHQKMYALISRCIAYYADVDFSKMFFYTYQISEENNTQETYIEDCNTMIFKLQGLLDMDKNYPTARSIIKDIEFYKKAKSAKAVKSAIKKLFFTYSDRIKFNKIVEKAITEMDEPLTLSDYADKTMLEGMLAQIENYAVELCNGKTTKVAPSKTTEKLVLNVHNTNNNALSQTVEIDISVEIENAIKRVEDACLPDAQEKEVLAKIQELKDIMESKESKGKRWAKIKDFFKWVAEQGIQVASIIVPLLATTIK